MSRTPKPPVFLQRANYRERRWRDAAKLVPFLGIILWTLPLAWPVDTPQNSVGSYGLIYIFSVWIVLIILAAVLSGRLRSAPPTASEDAPDA